MKQNLSSFIRCSYYLPAIFLCSYSAFAEPEVRDDSGVFWEFGIGPDGNNYEFNFATVEGLGYEIQTSNDLISWQRSRLYRGFGVDTRHPLFAAPQVGDAAVPPIVNEEVVENYVQPENVSIRYSRVVDSSGLDIGFQFSWVSLEDGVTLLNYTVYGQTLHEFFPPVYTSINGSFYYHMGSNGSKTQVDPNSSLLGKDAAVVANWLDHLDEINAESAEYEQMILNHQPVPADPNANKFFRIRQVSMDSDGDGWTDDVEALVGTDYFDRDTDNDGLEDPYDTDPLVNAAIVDPDGAGLDASLEDDLLARWDFEPTFGKDGLEDKSGNGRNLSLAGQSLGESFSPSGMVSHGTSFTDGHFKRQAGFLRDDNNSINFNRKMTVSFWFRMDSGAISSTNSHVGVWNAGLSESYNTPRSGGGVNFWADNRVYGINVKKNVDGDELWAVGAFTFRNDHDGNPSTFLSDDPFLNGNEIKWVMPAGTSDSGDRWIHMVLVRDKNASGSQFSNGRTAVYVNGELVEEGQTLGWALENLGEWNNPNCQMFMGQSYSSSTGVAPVLSQFKGSFDRFRIYEKVLSEGQIEQLYKQDIDQDGLWDFSEQRSLLWRDSNGDGVRTPDEDSYTADPFYHDSPFTDHDDDELASLDEQNIHKTDLANPDSDGDLIPDGWEVNFNLDPLDDSDALADGDNDGVSNRMEYTHVSDPTTDDTDGDGALDGFEITQGSLPSDATDNGNVLDDEEGFAIKMSVGDQSSSASEDYVMNVFEIDEETGEERIIHRVRSGGFGEFKEETKSFFRRDKSYTFQIDWQSSNLDSSSDTNNPEGADYDYTFKVEPIGDVSSLVVDKYNSDLERADMENPISGTQNDVDDFQTRVEPSRVVLFPIEIYQPVLVDGLPTRLNGRDRLRKVDEVRPSAWFDAYKPQGVFFAFNGDFNNVDRDRFHIRFPVNWQAFSEMPTMHLTSDGGFPTQLNFTKVTELGKSFYQSQGLLIVLDEVDDETVNFNDPSPTGESTSAGGGRDPGYEGVDNEEQDATHLVINGNKEFNIRMNATNGNATISIDKKIKVKQPTHELDVRIIMLLPENDSSPATLQFWRNRIDPLLTYTKHCYGRIGIDFIPTAPDVELVVVSQSRYDTITADTTISEDEAEALIPLAGSQPLTKPIIFLINEPFFGRDAFAFGRPQLARYGHIFLSLEGDPADYRHPVLGHELGHILGYIPRADVDEGFYVGRILPDDDHLGELEAHNIMVSGAHLLFKGDYLDSKRFNLFQKNLFLSSSFVIPKP